MVVDAAVFFCCCLLPASGSHHQPADVLCQTGCCMWCRDACAFKRIVSVATTHLCSRWEVVCRWESQSIQNSRRVYLHRHFNVVKYETSATWSQKTRFDASCEEILGLKRGMECLEWVQTCEVKKVNYSFKLINCLVYEFISHTAEIPIIF